MKRIVLCCDGTWQSADKAVPPTNIVKLAHAINPTAHAETPGGGGVTQVVYYDPGVGTGNILDQLRGGAFGHGLGLNVREAYRFLVHNYEDGDQICFFGFSRGAFTVRSVAGFIRSVGLLQKLHAGRINEAWDIYKGEGEDRPEAREFRGQYCHKVPPEAAATALRDAEKDPEASIPIHLIGVFDTVGSLGIPGTLNFLTHRRFKFHDVRLSRGVSFAFQALAIDEKRKFFKPTLWEQNPEVAGTQVLEQVWFAGCHADIGGGNAPRDGVLDTGLSDIALQWMVSRAESAGLSFDHAYLDSVCKPDPRGRIHESLGFPYSLIGAHNRPIGKGVPPDLAKFPPPEPSRESVHESACARLNDPDAGYNPPSLDGYPCP